MRILVLCRQSDLPWYGWAYWPALERQGARLSFIPEETSEGADIELLLACCPERPSLILRPDYHQFALPWGLTKADIPTVVFHEDVYAYTHRRIRWSMLFDYAVLFHPGFESAFRESGHPNPLMLPLGAFRDLFQGPEKERDIEVGSVGRVDGTLYASRRRILPELSHHFGMNDWRRHYTPAEMVDIYQRSKIVINISRDDWPQEANMRTFEVMGAGALLVTRLPSELSQIGFQEGIHFVGYCREEEIVPLLWPYLKDERSRCQIAAAGKEKVLREHTYDCRAAALLERVRQDGGLLSAPARHWREPDVRLLYLDWHSGRGQLNLVWRHFRQLARRSLPKALAGTSLLGRAWARQLRKHLVRPDPVRPWEMPSGARDTAQGAGPPG